MEMGEVMFLYVSSVAETLAVLGIFILEIQ
jgi:hypothetical protein